MLSWEAAFGVGAGRGVAEFEFVVPLVLARFLFEGGCVCNLALACLSLLVGTVALVEGLAFVESVTGAITETGDTLGVEVEGRATGNGAVASLSNAGRADSAEPVDAFGECVDHRNSAPPIRTTPAIAASPSLRERPELPRGDTVTAVGAA